MAIDNAFISVLSKLIQLIRHDKKTTLRTACLSYPDILLSPGEIVNYFNDLNIADILEIEGEEILKWHGIQGRQKIVDTENFFKKIDCNVDCFDFEKMRGGEIVVDLNYPLADIHQNKYDLVIDTGTLEHCFNVAEAFINMCKLCSIDGYIITAAPMTKINHGFWNFSPCAYGNFFSQNNFEIIYAVGFAKKEGKLEAFEIPENDRVIFPAESIIIVVAKKTINSTYKFPIQAKYTNKKKN
jgi:hypothetical protein